MVLYELALMGAASDAQARELQKCLAQVVAPFGLRLGHEITWSVRPASFLPAQKTPATVAFFGAPGVSEAGLDPLLAAGVPILPIASAESRISAGLPAKLKPLNWLTWAGHGREESGK